MSELSFLPIPEPALEHHLKTLAGPMEEWLRSGRFPPVLLLTGLSGVGKRSMGYYLAQWIFCERVGFSKNSTSDSEETGSLFGNVAPTATMSSAPENDFDLRLKPCGECTQCHRALNGNWVDFTEISGDSETETSTGTLKIEQFRRLKETAGFGAHEGRHKVILIPNADRMTPQAANSVLKILEEPPRDWIFLLTASDPTLVLPTVLSRCQALKLKPMAPGTILKILTAAGILGEKQKVSAALSEGSWGRALSLASDDVLEHRQSLFDFLERPQGSLNALVDWAAQSPSQLTSLFDQLEMICLDLIHWSLNQEARSPYVWINPDGGAALKIHADFLSQKLDASNRARDFWIARSERIAQARREALTPLNRKLLLQDVLMPWLEASR